MNFTTDLPKRNPLVSYIVASAVRCEKFFPGQNKGTGPVYRMHAVILKTGKNPRGVKDPAAQAIEDANQKNAAARGAGSQWNPQDDLGTPKTKELYICCHVRRVELGIEENDDSGGGKAAPENQLSIVAMQQVVSLKQEVKKTLTQS